MTVQNYIQPQAQANVPVSVNNGNPFTIYNQTPNRGGYLPPVSNAYDEWRINPLAQPTGSPFAGSTGSGGAPIFPSFNFGNNGSGGQLPVLPPSSGSTTPPPAGTQQPTGSSNPGILFPTSSGGWMLGGPTFIGGGSGLDGSLNTGYTTPGFNRGVFGQGFNGMSTGGSVVNPGSGGSGINPTIGNILDWFIPGDAFQSGHFNWQNAGLGAVDQITGLPVSWGLDRLARTDWANTSDSSIARWLREWSGINDSEALYGSGSDIRGGPTGWLTGAFDYLNRLDQGVSDTASGQWNDLRNLMAQLLRNPSSLTPEQIYALEGQAGLIGRTNPTTGRGYTPRQINDASRANGTGMGVGYAAAGAMGSRWADALVGEDARRAFAQMYANAIFAPTFQMHNNMT